MLFWLKNKRKTTKKNMKILSTESNDWLKSSYIVFNFFNVMGQNIYKQSQIWGPNILTCIDNYIWQFLMFTGVLFTTKG